VEGRFNCGVPEGMHPAKKTGIMPRKHISPTKLFIFITEKIILEEVSREQNLNYNNHWS